jgi:hypothetical protein
MILIVPSRHIRKLEADLKRRREKFRVIGRIERTKLGEPHVFYSGQLDT